jgi:hypothetical protein
MLDRRGIYEAVGAGLMVTALCLLFVAWRGEAGSNKQMRAALDVDGAAQQGTCVAVKDLRAELASVERDANRLGDGEVVARQLDVGSDLFAPESLKPLISRMRDGAAYIRARDDDARLVQKSVGNAIQIASNIDVSGC